MSLTTGTIDHADRYWCSGFRQCCEAPCLPSMSGFEMFCERCGKRYGSGEAAATSSLPLTKRFLLAVGVSTSVPKPPADEPFLRFCLACRGYSCPSCWNDEAGFCQTCVPMPEPVVEHVHLPVYEAPPSMAFAPTELTAAALAFGQTDLPPVADLPPAVDATAESSWAADTAIPWAPESQVPWATETPAVPWSTDPTLAAPGLDQAAGDVFPTAPEVGLPESAVLDDAQFEAAEAEAAEPVAVEPVAVEPVSEPADEPVVPAMSFGEPVPAAPFLAFAVEDDVAAVEGFDAAFEAEVVAEPEVAEVETLAEDVAVADEVEQFAVEADAVEMEAAEVEAPAEEAEVEAAAEAAEPVAAAAEFETVEAEAVSEAAPSLAMGERPLELVAAEFEEFVEPEPEAPFDWQEIPVDEPVAAAVEPVAVTAAAEERVEVPPAEPVTAEPEVVMPPPVFRPLPPLGPIVPPPPPVPSMPVPRMEFDLPDAPPAFVIAPAQPPQTRVLPTGMFDGPSPAIRPCAHCDLPVSAKARFCRRCGSAQEPISPS